MYYGVCRKCCLLVRQSLLVHSMPQSWSPWLTSAIMVPENSTPSGYFFWILQIVQLFTYLSLLLFGKITTYLQSSMWFWKESMANGLLLFGHFQGSTDQSSSHTVSHYAMHHYKSFQEPLWSRNTYLWWVRYSGRPWKAFARGSTPTVYYGVCAVCDVCFYINEAFPKWLLQVLFLQCCFLSQDAAINYFHSQLICWLFFPLFFFD